MSEPTTPQYRAVPGSERAAPANATPAGPVDPSERIEVSIYLRPRGGADVAQAEAASATGLRQPLSREEFAQRYGADPADIAQVERFAREHNLTVVESSIPRRVVVLAGTVAQMNAAFQVDLQRYERDSERFRGRTGHVYVPAELANIVTGIFGLDDRPQTRSYARSFAPAGPIVLAADAAAVSYTPPQVAALYSFPTAGNGSGQTIALIELGGGYAQSDLDTYFQQLGLATPTVVSVSVDGATNAPTGDPNSADGEVVLDIEVAGGVAPGARIAVYFAPNTDQGFLDAVTTATHDTTNTPSVISISWGAPESSWTAQAQQQMSQAFADAGMLGITVCCAAGDGGASDGVGDGLLHVDFPSSSPNALGCGGTSLTGSGGTITSETVWNDGNGSATGGGVSDTFDLPTWQAQAGVPPSANPGGRVGRGVPDVAADADPQTGYQILVDGQSVVIGGTSAAAPLWAGLIALLNQQLGQPVGFLNPVLYQQLQPTAVMHDVTSGNNDGYTAGTGWDACTGYGSPNGAALVQALMALRGQPAGAPPAQPTPAATAEPQPVEAAPVAMGTASDGSQMAAAAPEPEPILASEPAPEPEPISVSEPVPEPVMARTSEAERPRGFFAAFKALFRRG